MSKIKVIKPGLSVNSTKPKRQWSRDQPMSTVKDRQVLTINYKKIIDCSNK